VVLAWVAGGGAGRAGPLVGRWFLRVGHRPSGAWGRSCVRTVLLNHG